MPFRQPPADRSVLRQYWQRASTAAAVNDRCADPEMLRPHRSADPDHRSVKWGHSELGVQSGRKNPPACLHVCLSMRISPEPHARSLPIFCGCCLGLWVGHPPALCTPVSPFPPVCGKGLMGVHSAGEVYSTIAFL